MTSCTSQHRKARLFYDVADGQRLGMKIKSRCHIKFAGLAKLATSVVDQGESVGSSGYGSALEL
jgi:hypothetical protein